MKISKIPAHILDKIRHLLFQWIFLFRPSWDIMLKSIEKSYIRIYTWTNKKLKTIKLYYIVKFWLCSKISNALTWSKTEAPWNFG